MSKNVELIKQKLNEADVIFFDLDGTLIDTEHLYFRFWKEACAFFGYEMSDEEALSMRSRDSQSGMEYLDKISKGKLDYYRVKEKRIELMSLFLKTHPIKMKDGARELLRKLRKENKKLYVVTANTVEKATRIITSLRLQIYFEKVISAKDVKRGKPFPDVYIEGAKSIGVNPKDIVVFEDSPNGLKSSYSAGCFTIMAEDLTPYTEDMDYVDGAVSSLEELL